MSKYLCSKHEENIDDSLYIIHVASFIAMYVLTTILTLLSVARTKDDYVLLFVLSKRSKLQNEWYEIFSFVVSRYLLFLCSSQLQQKKMTTFYCLSFWNEVGYKMDEKAKWYEIFSCVVSHHLLFDSLVNTVK